MAYVVSKTLSGRTVKVYRESEYPVPVIFSTQYQEQGKTVLELLGNLGAPEVNLVTISDLHWEEDLSPWAHGPVMASTDHFTGGAPQYLEFLEKEVIPFAGQHLALDPSTLILAGYSMSGLLSAYSLFMTDDFPYLVSASGSLWFPGFLPFAKEQGIKGSPKAVYLSLGDTESHSRNPYLKENASVTSAIAGLSREAGIPTALIWERGGHFNEPAARLARGLCWVLGVMRGEDIKIESRKRGGSGSAFPLFIGRKRPRFSRPREVRAPFRSAGDAVRPSRDRDTLYSGYGADRRMAPGRRSRRHRKTRAHFRQTRLPLQPRQGREGEASRPPG